jgi:hypothetical protein
VADLRAREAARPDVVEDLAERDALLGRDDEVARIAPQDFVTRVAGAALAGVVEEEDAASPVEDADERLRRLREGLRERRVRDAAFEESGVCLLGDCGLRLWLPGPLGGTVDRTFRDGRHDLSDEAVGQCGAPGTRKLAVVTTTTASRPGKTCTRFRPVPVMNAGGRPRIGTLEAGAHRQQVLDRDLVVAHVHVQPRALGHERRELRLDAVDDAVCDREPDEHS